MDNLKYGVISVGVLPKNARKIIIFSDVNSITYKCNPNIVWDHGFLSDIYVKKFFVASLISSKFKNYLTLISGNVKIKHCTKYSKHG
jgi:hypothetical protein